MNLTRVFNSIISLTSAYHQRRAWAVLNKYLPARTKVVRVNSKPAHDYSKDAWYKTEKGIRVIINEYVKLAMALTHNDA